MAEIPKHPFREVASFAIARFLMRYRRPVAAMLLLAGLIAAYPLVNTVLYLAGHRLPGPIVRIYTPANLLRSPHG